VPGVPDWRGSTIAAGLNVGGYAHYNPSTMQCNQDPAPRIVLPDQIPERAAEPRIYLVAAVASNGVIGAQGRLPWRLPEDLRHFKRLTLGYPVIMGRKTWESLGKPLLDRENIVVTRRPGYAAPGASVARSFAAALALCTGERLVFEPYTPEMFAHTHRWVASWEIFSDTEDQAGRADYASAVLV